MAETQTTVALNIGSQRISMAIFETSKSGALILKGYQTDTIIADPAFEASRESQIKVGLEDLVEKLQIPKGKVRYAISGQSVFTRFVKLPPLQEDNIEQLVTFEAQQHVPFPINEVVWDYEMIEGGDEKEVVIVAIKSDALDEINETVTSANLSTVEVDVAPMALYNSFLETYGKPEEATLIIDVGAKTSNLLYAEGKRFFTRSVAIGGASITSAIAKEYDISFPDAEHQKISNGLVALGGGHTETMDESLAALAMVIRNALSRLPAEIARTTNYYRSQHGGSAPKKVLLAGGGANLPYTLEFFHEKLGIPVEFFNPLAQVGISKGLDTELLQREAHMMGELVGLGLRGIGKSTINIDLVPEAVEESRASERRKPFLIAAAAILMIGFGVWALLNHLAAAEAADSQRTMGEIQQKLSPVEGEIRALLETEEELTEVASEYTELEKAHAFWFDLLGELRGAFASDSVWLTEMMPLYGYDAFPAEDEEGAGIASVAGNFDGGKAMIGSLIAEAPDPVEASEQRPRGKANSVDAVEEAVPRANAIRVTGFWRENPKSQNIVSDLLASLRENSRMFRFTAENPEGEEVELSDEQLLKISAVGEEGDLSFPFELTLPLLEPVAVR